MNIKFLAIGGGILGGVLVFLFVVAPTPSINGYDRAANGRAQTVSAFMRPMMVYPAGLQGMTSPGTQNNSLTPTMPIDPTYANLMQGDRPQIPTGARPPSSIISPSNDAAFSSSLRGLSSYGRTSSYQCLAKDLLSGGVTVCKKANNQDFFWSIREDRFRGCKNAQARVSSGCHLIENGECLAPEGAILPDTIFSRCNRYSKIFGSTEKISCEAYKPYGTFNCEWEEDLDRPDSCVGEGPVDCPARGVGLSCLSGMKPCAWYVN